MSEIVIFDAGEDRIEVRLEAETVWLSLLQLTELFGRDKSVISRHLRNLFREGELRREAVVAKKATTASDGKVYQVEHFNLDVIISVGYRVNSLRATRFRQWATGVLRDHLTEGYSLNEHRLARHGLAELEQAVEVLGHTLTRQELVSDLGQEVVGLILGYARSWRWLRDYDEGDLGMPPGTEPARGVLAVAEARRALNTLAEELRDRGEAGPLFALDRDNGLSAILGNVGQSMFGEPLYRTREERAAHLLYFMIKSHPFADGNKRSGAFLFLLYLRQEGVPLTLDERALTALTLLIAESAPRAKEMMVRLVAHLITSPG